MPGQRLGRAEEYICGTGTYVRQSTVHAARLGVKLVVPPQKDGERSTISVVTEEATVVPEVGAVVVAKITSVNPRFAKCDIICVGKTPLRVSFSGMIRSRDVRATEKDKVELYRCFRPGDVVRAEVISLGDSRNYLLTTAKNELGVVFAESVAGATMVPVSWCEMQCPKTNAREFRKVAKPVTA